MYNCKHEWKYYKEKEMKIILKRTENNYNEEKLEKVMFMMEKLKLKII